MGYRLTTKNNVVAASNTVALLPDISPYTMMRISTPKDLLIGINADPASTDFLLPANKTVILNIEPGDIVHVTTAVGAETGNVRWSALSSQSGISEF